MEGCAGKLQQRLLPVGERWLASQTRGPLPARPLPTSSGLPRHTSRSLPTPRSCALRSRTLSSRNCARKRPVLGLPHALAAKKRGSKQKTGSTSSTWPAATRSAASCTTGLSCRRRSVPRNQMIARLPPAYTGRVVVSKPEEFASLMADQVQQVRRPHLHRLQSRCYSYFSLGRQSIALVGVYEFQDS